VYGISAALALGAGDISPNYGFGLAIGFLVTPARIRFGEAITHELSVDVGALLITSEAGVDPLLRFSYTLFF
jgi:hypothetical protein